MSKGIRAMVAAWALAAMLHPCLVGAQEIDFSNGESSCTWTGYELSEGAGTVKVPTMGEYHYLPEEDSFRFQLYLETDAGKARDSFLIIEDMVLGKPVSSLHRQEYSSDQDCYFPGVYVPDSVTDLGWVPFRGMQFPHIYLSCSVKTIPELSFYGNSELERVTLPASLRAIGDEAFMKCTRLDAVKVPDKVRTIGRGAFGGCTSLTKVYLPSSLRSIGKDAFKNCGNLTVYCQEGSYAHRYAKKNKIKTKIVSGKTVKAKEIVGLPSSIEVGTQESSLLFPFAEPFHATSQRFIYISDNPSVAGVGQNGKVEGKQAGSATITVMTADGSHIQKKVKVTVKRGKTMVNPYFSLYQLKKGTTEYNADAMLYNRNPEATYELLCQGKEDIAEAKIVGGKLVVTAKKKGNAMFRVFELDGGGKREVGSFPISVINQKKVE